MLKTTPKIKLENGIKIFGIINMINVKLKNSKLNQQNKIKVIFDKVGS